jgi:heme ABC exporter ATP-binding subunit CcmA
MSARMMSPVGEPMPEHSEKPETAEIQPVAIPAAVEAVGLGKLFDVRPVLRGVSFTVPAGGTLALLGPNGAGKTTLLRILATLAKPSSGEAFVAGLDVQRDADLVRRVIGYVGHQPYVYEDLTVEENLLFFARMYGLRDGKTRARALLDRVGLRAKACDRVRTLSRGQLQRLALARGILHAPEVLLLDEPDTGLDEDASALLADLIAERAADGQTTIFTTHQIERGLRMSDEALALVGGRVAYAGPSAELDVAAVRALYAGAKGRTR